MCGIFCCILNSNNHSCPAGISCSCIENIYKTCCKKLISRRGPDVSDQKTVTSCGSGKLLYLVSHVLWQQGEIPQAQPIETKDGVLLFNGDIFGGKLKQYEKSWSDTLALSKEFSDNSDTLLTFSQFEGPYSVIYFNKNENVLYFGRDRIGRTSLLISKVNGRIVITSVANRNLLYTAEIPALGIFTVDLISETFRLFPWRPLNSNIAISQLKLFEQRIFTKIIIESSIQIQMCKEIRVHFNLETLASLIPRDETMMEYLLENIAINETINTLIKLLRDSVKQRVLCTPPFCKQCIIIGKTNSSDNLLTCLHSKVGILFSGGLDCSILAVLADIFIPAAVPIDLLNVAFERITKNRTNNKKKNGKRCPVTEENLENILYNDDNTVWNVPDRITGLQTLTELRKLLPNRVWNLVEINISRNELNAALVETIADLVYPLESVLDESLGAALWFASRGKGVVRTSNEMGNKFCNYNSTNRVLLMGMGADELFGGYSRHRGAFRKGGWDALSAVLEDDIAKIPLRNLGRDDRVVSDNSVQGRAPYLEENFMDFVQNLAAFERCCPSLPAGVGDKLLLRLAARRLGLVSAATLPKRALQFGCRIADSSQNGADVSEKLRSNTVASVQM